MHDLKYIIDNIEKVKELTSCRNYDFDFETLESLISKRKDSIHNYEQARFNQKNLSNQMIGLRPGSVEFVLMRRELRLVSDNVKSLEIEKKSIESAIEKLLLELPNLISAETPIGNGESDNKPIFRNCFDPENFQFTPKDHVSIGENLGIIDIEAAGRVSGSRFAFLRGAGAKLERALYNMMLDIHTTMHGYEEMSTPLLVNESSMLGTGQLPKFEKDLFKTDNLYLIPTAEVPLVNYHRDTILPSLDENIKFCALSPCFRSEAGGAGRDTRGLIRQHQFNKVELVKFCKPEESDREHHTLMMDALYILDLLELPCRVVELCSGDIGFGAQKCYDIEVWIPSQNCYREISSCSNMGSFQSRRANIRYRDSEGKPQYLHTINGSGLAVGRTLVALLENHQQEDGSVRIPTALQKWFGVNCIK
jgi:seryl-tRNA synthetase